MALRVADEQSPFGKRLQIFCQVECSVKCEVYVQLHIVFLESVWMFLKKSMSDVSK